MKKTLSEIKYRIFSVLRGDARGSKGANLVNAFLISLILLNVIAVTLETVEPLHIDFANFFDAFMIFSVSVFTMEYFVRVWTCTLEKSGRYGHPFTGRLRYMITPLAIIDLLAILPFYLSMFIGVDLRSLKIVRLLWIIKIMRYFPALITLGIVIKRERRTLAAVLVLMFLVLFITSSLVYLLEREGQPAAFASIPQAMWWGMATLTTVGYGDVVPHSALGKFLGMVIMLMGIGMFALPTGILASAFIEEVKKRSFIVNWGLVAQVPLFSDLKADEIARITELLRLRSCMPNEVIFRRGEDADGMYFILSGEVEVELDPKPLKLEKGNYIGEVALFYKRKRTATIISLTYTELLELDAKDFQRIIDSNPRLKQQIAEKAEARLARSPLIY